MDIKEKITEIAEKLMSDKSLMEKFTKNPSAAIKELTGLDIPKEQIDSVVAAVKAKIGADKLSGIAGALGGILGKK